MSCSNGVLQILADEIGNVLQVISGPRYHLVDMALVNGGSAG